MPRPYEEPEVSMNQDRTFTPEQANRTLPLVKRIVRDILEKHLKAAGVT